MVDDPKEPTIDFQDWFDGGNIFYRSKDKQRFQYAVNAIVEDDMGLAVIGTNETVLDHYCRMLLARLREHDKFQLDILLPTDTENLLKRFNEMVESMSIDQARKAPEDHELLPVKLLIINDAKLVKDEQWSLLERLLADFPGVNVRLVLFIDKTGCPNYEKPLGLFGRKLYRWVVETPSYAEAQQLFEAAKEHGYENAAGTLLRETGLAAAIEGMDSAPEKSSEGDALEGGIEQEMTTSDESEVSKSTWFSWVFFTVVLGCAAVAWQVSQQLNQASPAESQPVIDLAIIPEAQNLLSHQAEKPEKLEEQGRTDSEGNTPSEAKTGGEEKIEKVERPQAQSADTSTRRLIPIKQAVLSETAKRLSPTSPSTEASSNVSANKPPVTAAPVSQSQPTVAAGAPKSAAEIVAASASSDFFVQYIVLSDSQQALNFVRRYPSLTKKALLLPIRSQGTAVTAVLSGPFKTRTMAEEFAKGANLPADYWIREAELLKSVVQSD